MKGFKDIYLTDEEFSMEDDLELFSLEDFINVTSCEDDDLEGLFSSCNSRTIYGYRVA